MSFILGSVWNDTYSIMLYYIIAYNLTKKEVTVTHHLSKITKNKDVIHKYIFPHALSAFKIIKSILHFIYSGLM